MYTTNNPLFGCTHMIVHLLNNRAELIRPKQVRCNVGKTSWTPLNNLAASRGLPIPIMAEFQTEDLNNIMGEYE